VGWQAGRWQAVGRVWCTGICVRCGVERKTRVRQSRLVPEPGRHGAVNGSACGRQ